MTTYKLFRVKDGRLFPLYVEHKREMKVGIFLEARIGELVDENHVKAHGLGGKVALRPGFHSTFIPFTDWIGKRGNDRLLYQRPDTVWAECEVIGKEQIVKGGLKVLPSDWYLFRTNSRQKDPWIISNNILIRNILSHDEVKEICEQNGYRAQEIAME